MPKVKQDGPWLAVNLFDLDRIDPKTRHMLLSTLVDPRAIRVDKEHMDETAVAFKCALLMAATVCDMIRDHDRAAGDRETRVYLKKATVWDRLPYDARLTTIQDGKSVLDRKLFGLPCNVIEDDDYKPQRVL